jgi:hypothetical protein
MATGTYFETEGATGSKSREGVVQWVVPYYVSSLSLVDSLPSTYEGCGKVSSTWVSNNDGTSPSAIVTVTYEGADDTSMNMNGDEYDKPSWSIDFDLIEMPIESHWNFEKIKNMYGGGYDPDDPERWLFPKTMPVGSGGTGLKKGNDGEGKENPMYGVRTYIVMYTRVSKSYTKKTTPDVVSKIGKQLAGIPGAPSEFNDLAKGERSWLQLPPRVSKRGKVWEVTESWKLSEYREWQDEVYKKFTSK